MVNEISIKYYSIWCFLKITFRSSRRVVSSDDSRLFRYWFLMLLLSFSNFIWCKETKFFRDVWPSQEKIFKSWNSSSQFICKNFIGMRTNESNPVQNPGVTTKNLYINFQSLEACGVETWTNFPQQDISLENLPMQSYLTLLYPSSSENAKWNITGIKSIRKVNNSIL